jgi:hypothetical protein
VQPSQHSVLYGYAGILLLFVLIMHRKHRRWLTEDPTGPHPRWACTKPSCFIHHNKSVCYHAPKCLLFHGPDPEKQSPLSTVAILWRKSLMEMVEADTAGVSPDPVVSTTVLTLPRLSRKRTRPDRFPHGSGVLSTVSTKLNLDQHFEQ